jgi:microcystin-dependent protein
LLHCHPWSLSSKELTFSKSITKQHYSKPKSIIMDPYMGMIGTFGFTYAPYNWALCLGQIMPIARFTTLYSLLSTNFGGDGKTTFGLPDLRDCAPIGSSATDAGAGLTPYKIGARGGVKNITLGMNHMPAHKHDLTLQLRANSGRADSNNPMGKFPGKPDNGNAFGPAGMVGDVTMKGPAAVLDQTGNSLPLQLQQPMLAVNYSIALEGIFPDRS